MAPALSSPFLLIPAIGSLSVNQGGQFPHRFSEGQLLATPAQMLPGLFPASGDLLEVFVKMSQHSLTTL